MTTQLAPSNKLLIVHQCYKVFSPFDGKQIYRIDFLCPQRGVVQIYREVPIVADEFEQAALVRAAIAQFRNA